VQAQSQTNASAGRAGVDPVNAEIKIPREWPPEERPPAALESRFRAFWQCLLNCKYRYNEASGALLFPDGVFVLGLEGLGQALYVRPCYLRLLERIVALWRGSVIGKRGVVVSGNPGIGKSLFLCYVMLRAAIEKRTVAYERRESDEVFVCYPDGSVILSHRKSSTFLEALQDERCFYLFDPAGKQDSVEPLHLNVRASSLVVSSPNPIHFHSFEKWYLKHIYAPVWSLSEVLQARLICYPTVEDAQAAGQPVVVADQPRPVVSLSAEEAVRRWNVFGGIARYIFCTPDDFAIQYTRLLGVIALQRIEDVLTSVKELEQMDTISHRVLHYIVDETTYASESVMFASDFVFSQLMKSGSQQLSDRLLQFVVASADRPIVAALRGYVFERLCHAVIAAGGQFKCRPLTPQADLQPEQLVTIPALKTIYFSRNDEIPEIVTREFTLLLALHGGNQAAALQSLRLLLRPTAPNFAFADAMILAPFPVALQDTVSRKHKLKRHACLMLQSALKSLFGPHVLDVYLLLPPDIYVMPRRDESFVDSQNHVVDPPSDVRQWAFCVPLTPGMTLPPL